MCCPESPAKSVATIWFRCLSLVVGGLSAIDLPQIAKTDFVYDLWVNVTKRKVKVGRATQGQLDVAGVSGEISRGSDLVFDPHHYYDFA